MQRLRTIFTLSVATVAVACGQPGMAGPGPSSQRSLATQAGPLATRESEPRGGRFSFGQLVSVQRPYTGATNAIRGVPGGGLPWAISEGHASLEGGRRLRVEVEGLVLDPNDAAVIARGLAGQNPIASAKAIVSCLTIQDGAAVTVNVSSDPVPFSTGLSTDGGGNASIEQDLVLPSPCLAPLVLVGSAAGAWFAASGL